MGYRQLAVPKNASEETHLLEPLKQCSDDKNFHTNHSSSFVNFTFNVFPPLHWEMTVFSKKHSKKPDFIEDFDVFAIKE